MTTCITDLDVLNDTLDRLCQDIEHLLIPVTGETQLLYMRLVKHDLQYAKRYAGYAQQQADRYAELRYGARHSGRRIELVLPV